MTDELLKAATQALREETAEPGEEARLTRARVMASLHHSKVKSRTRLAFVLPIAACLAAGTAWGAATGRLPAIFQAVSRVLSNTPKPPARSQDPSRHAAAAAPSPAREPLAQPTSVVAAPGPGKPEPARSAKAALPSSSGAFQDTDGDLYRLAHEAHFSSHDYGRALAGWDAYLTATPRGRLATEARYNRAICLLRLGREAEARQALEPFASGQLGYRQTEARELLDELAR